MATQVDYETQIRNLPATGERNVLDFDWDAQSPSQTLTAGTAATVNLSPWPEGITAKSPSAHYLLIVDAVSGNEEVLLTAISTNTSVTFTPSLTHASGNWSIKSATYGIQEAHYASLAQTSSVVNRLGYLPFTLYIPNGLYSVSEIFLKKVDVNAVVRVAIRGENRWMTQLMPRSNTQNTITWVGSYNANLVDCVTISDLRFVNYETGGWQTGGSCIYLNGHIYADINRCVFNWAYRAISMVGYSGFNRVFDCWSQNTVDRFVYQYTTAVSIYHISRNYVDGRYTGSAAVPLSEGLAPSLIDISGPIGGGIISENWMQAAENHITITSTNTGTGYADISEVMIHNNLLDQDSYAQNVASAISIVNIINAQDVGGTWVTVTGNYINTSGYGVIVQKSANVSIISNPDIRVHGTSPPVAVVDSSRVYVDNNILKDRLTTIPYFILLQNTNASYGNDLYVRNNTAITKDETVTGADIGAFVGMGLTYGNRIFIENNNATRTTALILPSAVPARANVTIRNNTVPNYVPANITAATAVTIPYDDDGTISVITGTSTISQFVGGQPGMKRTFLAANTVTLGTGGSTPGDIAVAKTISVNEAFDINYYAASAKFYAHKSA